MVYDFIKNMWIMQRITLEQIDVFVSKGYITQAEAEEIKNLFQVEGG